MGFIVIGLAYLTVIFRRFCSSDYYKHLRTFVIPAATQTNGNGIDEIDEIDEIDGTDEIDDTLRTDLPSMEVWGEYASQDDESHMVSLMGNPVTVTVGENDLVSSVFSGWGQNPLPQLSNGQGKPTNVNSFPGNSIHKHKRNESASSTTVHSKIKATDKQSASVVHHHHEKTIIQCKHTVSHHGRNILLSTDRK